MGFFNHNLPARNPRRYDYIYEPISILTLRVKFYGETCHVLLKSDIPVSLYSADQEALLGLLLSLKSQFD